MAEKKGQEGQQLNIELPEELAEGVYSNLAFIAHSPEEFIIDFIRMVPNVPKAKVKSRVVLNPKHAKRFAAALVDNIKKYERQFGPIQDSNKNQTPPITFNAPPAQA